MTKQIEYDYFEWLISQIEIRSSRTYHELFERMHNTEFVWFVPNDDNRVQDGLDLRIEFVNDVPMTRKEHEAFNMWLRNKGSTVLEVLIGLSRRVAFTAGGVANWWAWKLIENVHLQRMSDPLTREKTKRIDEVLDALIWRTYNYDGKGGFFPLTEALEDQTKIEIWYQMNKYVMEIQEP